MADTGNRAAGAGTAARRLVAVVVTYNRLDQLRVTVARLLDSPPDDLAALVVVDNASSDDTGLWLTEQDDPRLDVLRTPGNLGGAGGFRTGLAHALRAHAPDWLVVMDDDGRPAPGALAAFHGADLTGWDAVAAAVYTPLGAVCEINRPMRNPFASPARLWGFVRGHPDAALHFGPPDYAADTARPADVASFVGLFLRADALARAGLPDRRLVYTEDAVYTLSFTQQGLTLGFLPQIRFEHDWATFAGTARGFLDGWKVYYYHRNLLMLYRRAVWPVLFWPAVVCLIVPKWTLRCLRQPQGRADYARHMMRAVRDALRGDLPEPPYGPFHIPQDHSDG